MICLGQKLVEPDIGAPERGKREMGMGCDFQGPKGARRCKSENHGQGTASRASSFRACFNAHDITEPRKREPCCWFESYVNRDSPPCSSAVLHKKTCNNMVSQQ